MGSSQRDGEAGIQNVSRGDPGEDLSWLLAGLPQLGSTVETKWWVTFRKEVPSSPRGASESENSDSGNDGNFTPRAKNSKGRKRPLKRAKKTTRQEEERWWPGIVTKLQIESDHSVSGLIKYTFREDDHGILPGGGLSQFTGKTCRVMFEARKPGESSVREVHHYVDGKDDDAIITPWRYFFAPGDGRGPSTSHGLPDRHGFGLHESTAPAMVTIAPARALPNSIPAAAGVCLPPAVRALQTFGMHKLVTSLQAMTQPPPRIKTVFTQPLDDGPEMKVVRPTVLYIGGAFQATQSDFAELATWLRRGVRGGQRARVSLTPREENFHHPAHRESFRVMFHDYGDFCDACQVPVRLRSVFLWDKNLANKGSPELCVVGTVQVWESASVGPVEEETVRMSAKVRVILLGHSWNRIVSYKPVDESDDVAIPLLRQCDITYDRECEDSRHPFTAEIGASAARVVEEASGKMRSESEDEEGSFDIDWKPLVPVEGVNWNPKDTLGTVGFRIPLVCIRSPSLVKSARALLDTVEQIDGEESESAAENRIDFSEELRYAVVSPLGRPDRGRALPNACTQAEAPSDTA